MNLQNKQVIQQIGVEASLALQYWFYGTFGAVLNIVLVIPKLLIQDQVCGLFVDKIFI
jgi:hypothetical protein